MSDNFTAVFREVGSERVDPAIVEVAINNYMKDHPGAGAVTEEQISNIVTAYLQNHPIEGGVNAEEVNTAIESYLQANPVVGEKGEKGDKGDTGDTGADGKSAYEIAVENGFEGTEAEWLESLKGEDGTASGEVDAEKVNVGANNHIFDINHLALRQNLDMSLENGVYRFGAPKSGNVWSDYKVYDSDLEAYDGHCLLKINVAEISGTWRLYALFKNTNGEMQYRTIKDITKVGEQQFTFDLGYYTVYLGYDGKGVNFAIANTVVSTDETTYSITIDAYDLYGGDSIITARPLTDVISEIDNKMDMIEGKADDDTVILISPNGSENILQATASGTLVLIPRLPNNILYIGNSLLTGFGNRGMAATTVDGDYYAKVNAFLNAKGISNLTTTKQGAQGIEGVTTDADVETWITTWLESKMSNDRQLVIVQLGDNANNAERRTQFKKTCARLASYIREHCPNARVAWVGTWYGSLDVNETVKDACKKYGMTYVSLAGANTTEHKSAIGTTYIDSNGNEQTITEAGVASHPNDLGFTEIADRITETLFGEKYSEVVPQN